MENFGNKINIWGCEIDRCLDCEYYKYMECKCSQVDKEVPEDEEIPEFCPFSKKVTEEFLTFDRGYVFIREFPSGNKLFGKNNESITITKSGKIGLKILENSLDRESKGTMYFGRIENVKHFDFLIENLQNSLK